MPDDGLPAVILVLTIPFVLIGGFLLIAWLNRDKTPN